MKLLLKAAWRGVRGLLLVLAAIVLFIEEWGWRPLTALAARLARWRWVARLEAWLRLAPPRVALGLFLVPALLLLPIKLLALWFIQRGHIGFGLTVIIAAKLLGTALVGRLFILVEPQLMQFVWFARALGWWRATKLRIMTRVHGSAAWRSMRAAAQRARRWLRRLRD